MNMGDLEELAHHIKTQDTYLSCITKLSNEIERLRILNANLVESLKDLVEECREHDNEYQHVTRPPRLAKALDILIEMKGEK
jgi:hypothetical protein